MYTIFKENSSIILTDKLEKTKINNFYFYNDINLRDLLSEIKNDNLSIILFHPDLEEMWSSFKNYFKVIEAAGGLVQNPDKEILFIYRNNIWDLPKGKIEKNEKVSEAAIREVQEECGLEMVFLGDFITKTYHIYEYENQEILKISHWFFMESNEINLVPQLEEDITEVVWKNEEETKEAIKNTYPNIKLLINRLTA